MKKTALITGATSGIGRATAKLLAKNGFHLIICGRRQERLQELEKKLKETTDVFSLNFDISKKQEVLDAAKSLPQEFSKIDILVNNAGNAHGLSSFQNGDFQDWDTMIDTNVKGMYYVSKAFLERMPRDGSAHIINIGSVAGKEVYPNGNVYCASKHAVDALTKAMRIDLLPEKIKVSSVCPGMVETEFSLVRFKGDIAKAQQVYQGFDPLLAEDIADTILYIVTRPSRVNIADILIFPSAQASSKDVRRKN